MKNINIAKIIIATILVLITTSTTDVAIKGLHIKLNLDEFKRKDKCELIIDKFFSKINRIALNTDASVMFLKLDRQIEIMNRYKNAIRAYKLIFDNDYEKVMRCGTNIAQFWESQIKEDSELKTGFIETQLNEWNGEFTDKLEKANKTIESFSSDKKIEFKNVYNQLENMKKDSKKLDSSIKTEFKIKNIQLEAYNLTY